MDTELRKNVKNDFKKHFFNSFQKNYRKCANIKLAKTKARGNY